MKSREIDDKIKELNNQGDIIYDELCKVFDKLHKNKIYPPYDDNLPIIQKMRNFESQLDNIEKASDKLKTEKWIVCGNEEKEITDIMQGLIDNAIEIEEDGLIKHYIIKPKMFHEEIFKDYYMAGYPEYHGLLSKKYRYHVTFDNLDMYECHEPFYTNEPLDKLLEFCKNIMRYIYITDCTVRDMSKIKQYETLNFKSENYNINYIYYKYKDSCNYVVYDSKYNKVHSAHFSDDKIFIGYYGYIESPLVTIRNQQYVYEDNCIKQFQFTLVNSPLYKSDTTETNKLKKNLDKMLDKKYFGRFDETNQLLKNYYHI